MNIFDLSLKIKGFPINNARAELRKINSMGVQEFEEWKEKKKWGIVKYHYNNNSMYRDKFGATLPNNWDDIPIITKKDLQLPIGQMLSEEYAVSDVYINNTSGSSGHPFYFAKDKFTHALTWAIIEERYSRHGIHLGDKQARFFGIPLDTKGYYKEKLKDFLGGRVRFPVFDLSDDVLERFLKRFKHVSFKYINGYTSSVVLFARFILQKKMVLKQVCPSLKCCIVTSEVCTPEDRQVMQAAFGVPVINEYGASELDFIAIEDEEHDWVTTDESLFIEILDESNKPLEPGRAGKIVITSLFNKAMPFIRYEIGDMGSIAKNKKGKHHILEKLVGRTNDFALLPSGKKSPGLTFYYISKSMLESQGVVKEFLIRQIRIDTFSFEYVADRDLTLIEQSQINEMMTKYLEKGLKSEFIRKETLQRSGSGKIKHFYNELGLTTGF